MTYQTLTEVLLLRIIPDEMGTFKGLLRDLSKDSAHRRNPVKRVVLRHETIHLTQLLEKAEYRLVAIRLSENYLHAKRLS